MRAAQAGGGATPRLNGALRFRYHLGLDLHAQRGDHGGDYGGGELPVAWEGAGQAG